MTTKTSIGDVPCGTCTLCCYNELIMFGPDEGHLAMATRAVPEIIRGEPRWVIPHNADGSCINLIDGKCSVYNNRPRVCKHFDCRDYFLAVRDGRLDDGDAGYLKRGKELLRSLKR